MDLLCNPTGGAVANAYQAGESSDSGSNSFPAAAYVGVAIAVVNLAVLVAVAVHFARKRTAAKSKDRRTLRDNMSTGSSTASSSVSRATGNVKQNIGATNQGFRSSEVGTIRSLSSLASQFSITPSSNGSIEDDGNVSDSSSITSLA